MKAGSHEQRKRKRKRCSHVERKRKQNEIRTRISVPQNGGQDGGNLVPGVCVTLKQQSGSEDSGNKIKDGGRRRCFRIVFLSRFRPSSVKAKAPNAKAYRFLAPLLLLHYSMQVASCFFL